MGTAARAHRTGHQDALSELSRRFRLTDTRLSNWQATDGRAQGPQKATCNCRQPTAETIPTRSGHNRRQKSRAGRQKQRPRQQQDSPEKTQKVLKNSKDKINHKKRKKNSKTQEQPYAPRVPKHPSRVPQVLGTFGGTFSQARKSPFILPSWPLLLLLPSGFWLLLSLLRLFFRV